jgi:hypothetical protein
MSGAGHYSRRAAKLMSEMSEMSGAGHFKVRAGTAVPRTRTRSVTKLSKSGRTAALRNDRQLVDRAPRESGGAVAERELVVCAIADLPIGKTAAGSSHAGAF